jgi:hypothetical protein
MAQQLEGPFNRGNGIGRRVFTRHLCSYLENSTNYDHNLPLYAINLRTGNTTVNRLAGSKKSRFLDLWQPFGGCMSFMISMNQPVVGQFSGHRNHWIFRIIVPPLFGDRGGVAGRP